MLLHVALLLLIIATHLYIHLLLRVAVLLLDGLVNHVIRLTPLVHFHLRLTNELMMLMLLHVCLLTMHIGVIRVPMHLLLVISMVNTRHLCLMHINVVVTAITIVLLNIVLEHTMISMTIWHLTADEIVWLLLLVAILLLLLLN